MALRLSEGLGRTGRRLVDVDIGEGKFNHYKPLKGDRPLMPETGQHDVGSVVDDSLNRVGLLLGETTRNGSLW